MPVLVHNYTTDYDLYATGNAKGPTPARPKDFEISTDEAIGGLDSLGKSTFNSTDNIKAADLTGICWKLPAGTELPEGWGVKPDGIDVGGPRKKGHHTIYTLFETTLDKFNELLTSLPWTRDIKIK